MTATEEWRAIPSAPGYEVSNLGRVRSLRHRYGLRRQPKMLALQLVHGYPRVNLYSGGSYRPRRVHHLVAEAFIGPRPEGLIVRHLDGTRDNNVPENLAYGTLSENTQDCLAHGHHVQAQRTHCPQGHPYDEENTHHFRGWRRCRTCHNTRRREKYAAAKLAAEASS
ncbi:MAG TPA: NUMOD4 motif-containing HNH endonuclease [Miltoncostaeaceae bacterium]|nr:NUMOD4 motif-containing HNH endonuclease [Miltoncostaeaceae bacterium]